MCTTSAASVIHLDELNFDQTITDAKVPVFVHFDSTCCGSRRTIASVLDEIASELGEKVRFAKVDVDNNVELSSRLGIQNIPTLLILKSGEVKDQIVGLTSQADLVSRLKNVIHQSLYAREQPIAKGK